MGRIAVAFALMAAVAGVPQAARLPVALAGCGLVTFAYPGRIVPILARFLLLWVVFYAAVAGGRAWAGAPWSELVLDGAGSLGLALGVAGAVLLVVTTPPTALLAGMDRLRLPREFSYVVLALVGVLPYLRSGGTRQLALLRLKGIGTGSLVQRLRAYPRIVAPLFGQLLQRQWAHAQSMATRGFFERPGAPPEDQGKLNGRDGAVVVALLVLAALGWAVVAGVGTDGMWLAWLRTALWN